MSIPNLSQALVLIPPFLILGLLVGVPLNGVFVRLRAHYDPKCVQLKSENDTLPLTERVTHSYFGVLRRTYRIEGFSGLYKGLMPNVAFSIIHTIFGVSAGILIADRCPKSSGYKLPCGDLGLLLIQVVYFIVHVPELIIVQRAITTPRKLPYFGALYSLRTLLTPTERQRPWTLYLTPGVLPALALSTAYYVLVPRILRTWLLNMDAHGTTVPNQVFARILVHIMVAVLTATIMTPVEVALVRLSIQRRDAVSWDYTTAAQEAGDHNEEDAVYTEDVIELRTDRKPYTGLVDCAKHVIAEEGWPALYRGWWATLLFGAI